ncbi:hypothetical protein I3679_013775 [Proteus mirabilis]|uniref:Uncharacterized protein n=1 Tax=Proteus mirabilis TaxID=584 RepID=A0ABD5LVT1_PROMI
MASQRDTLRTVTAQLAVAGKPDEQIAVLSDGLENGWHNWKPARHSGHWRYISCRNSVSRNKKRSIPGCQGKTRHAGNFPSRGFCPSIPDRAVSVNRD